MAVADYHPLENRNRWEQIAICESWVGAVLFLFARSAAGRNRISQRSRLATMSGLHPPRDMAKIQLRPPGPRPNSNRTATTRNSKIAICSYLFLFSGMIISHRLGKWPAVAKHLASKNGPLVGKGSAATIHFRDRPIAKRVSATRAPLRGVFIGGNWAWRTLMRSLT